MLSDSQRHQIVNALLEAQATKKQATRPSAIYPQIDFADAYAISAAVARHKMEAGERLIGYKVGLTSIAMRRASKIDEPDYGYLFDTMIVADGARIPHAAYCLPRVELELAFRLHTPLRGPGVSTVDVLRATETIQPALEIIDARVDEPRKIYDTIADNGAGAGLVLGGSPFRPYDRDMRLIPGILFRNADIEETGLACGVMGHPANGVAWLANKLAELDLQLEAGHILLSGSFVRPVWANPGDTIRADFGDMGSVAVQFI